MNYQIFWGIIFLSHINRALSNSTCYGESDGEIKRHFYFEGSDLPLKIEVSNRTSHRLISTIAKIIITEALGYQKVELVVQEPSKGDNIIRTLDQITACSKKTDGENRKCSPEVMINLEVWQPVRFKMDEWLATGELDMIGQLGPVGRYGWYIPNYTIEYYWQAQRYEFDHYRAFTDPERAALFDLTNKTLGDFPQVCHKGDKECDDDGIYRPKHCIDMKCATLLAAYPDSSFELLKNTINEYKLYVKVLWVGDRLSSILEKNICTKKNCRDLNIVFYHRKPTSLSYFGQFVQVKFPSCEEDLSVTCFYEINVMQKVVWSKIRSNAYEAYHLLKHIHFTQEDYVDLLQTYMLDKSRSIDLDEIACKWVRSNMLKWDKWITEDYRNKIKLYIGGIFPLSGIHERESSVEEAARLAADAVNADESILANYNLTILAEDGGCNIEKVTTSLNKYLLGDKFSSLVGILGPSCTETVQSIIGLAKQTNLCVLSYSAEGKLSNSSNFYRTVPENTQLGHVYLEMLNTLEYRKTAALTEEAQKNTEYLSLLERPGINFVNKKLPKDRQDSTHFASTLNDLKKDFKIFIVDVFDYAARHIMCSAYNQGMTADKGYVWFFSAGLSDNWFDTDAYNAKCLSDKIECSTKQMMEAVNGHFIFSHNFYAADGAIMQEGKTVKQWLGEYQRNAEKHDKKISRYGGYAYDAVWVYAKALHQLFKEDDSTSASLHTETALDRLTELIRQSNFSGVSGDISFLGSSRKSDVIVRQWIDNVTRPIGIYRSTDESGLEINESAITWLTSDGKKPQDVIPPSLDENECTIEGFRKIFGGISCNTAIVILNVFGVVFFIVVIVAGFLIYKRQYDRKMRLREKRLEELGLTEANQFSLDEWEMAREHIVINRKLGEGAFGTVFGGETLIKDKGWIAVAVKTLKNGAKGDEKLDFLSEAEIMKQFEHVNIVKLVGVCTRGEPVYTIMEFMLYGDLKTYLLSRRNIASSEKDRMHNDEVCDKRLTNMALDIARGLSYLADKKYVHRDLACRNCLVNASRSVKIADFGMCRAMYDSYYYRYNKKGRLPVRWMAPESLISGLFTPMSDVWSYGVVLYELVTFANIPYQGLTNDEVLEHIKSHRTLTVPECSKPELSELFTRCWARSPNDRPPAKEIVEILALNPELITPCLDEPTPSIQILDTSTLELPDRGRVHSISSVWPGRRLMNEPTADGAKKVGKSLHESFHRKTKRKPPDFPQITYL